MKIDTFLKLYNTKKTEEEKAATIAQIMNNAHIGYADKVDRAGIIAKNSYHVKETGADGVEREGCRHNKAAKYMLYSLTLVDLYTTLEIDFKQKLVNGLVKIYFQALKDGEVIVLDTTALKINSVIDSDTGEDLEYILDTQYELE